MFLRASSSTISYPAASSAAPSSSSRSCSARFHLSKRTPKSRSRSLAANRGLLAGVVFKPFEEVKKEFALVPSAPDLSLARHKYADDCEAAVNAQINVAYNVSYAYHAMFAYFDRDNVALKGLAKFFKEWSEEEREHAEKLMEYQNKRGGKVKLQSMVMPLNEFDHDEKGDALSAMELALSLEKLVNEKLLNLHGVATRLNDVQMTNYIETEFLWDQVEAMKKMGEYVAQLRRVGKGHDEISQKSSSDENDLINCLRLMARSTD